MKVMLLFSVAVIGNAVLPLSGSLAQEIPGAANVVTIYRGANTADPNDPTGAYVERQRSPEEIAIRRQIEIIKKLDDGRQMDELLNLQRQLDAMTGETVTRPGVPYGRMEIYHGPQPFLSSPNDIRNVLVFNTGTFLTHGLATATEQRGATAGRIWAAVARDSGSNDRIEVLRSDDGGITWVPTVAGVLATNDQMNFDQMDMEIIENTTGEKYVYLFYTLRGNNGTGDWRSGYMVFRTPTIAGGLFQLNWPGVSPPKRVYRPRAISDNAFYLGNPWIYIVASFDSATASGRTNFQVYARILNPYNTAPTVTYATGKFYWFASLSGTALRDLHSDVAYFRNGGNDSILTVYSNIPDTTRLFFAKADINGNLGNATAAGGSIGGSEPGDAKSYARLSTNGSDNGSAICVFNQQGTTGARNVKYFRTTNSGNFNTIAGQSILWGSTVNTNFQPDIVGVRNGRSHYFAFETSAATDSVHFVSVTNTGTTMHIQRMNGLTAVSETQGPKPGFRYVANDSCFVLYSPNGPVSAWAASGCSGNLVSAPEERMPAVFVLSQNYPNPFNPTTQIRFQIPTAGHIQLAVYDVLGREVAVLLNDRREGGEHAVEFDATLFSSGVYFYRMQANTDDRTLFTATKKMIIMK